MAESAKVGRNKDDSAPTKSSPVVKFNKRDEADDEGSAPMAIPAKQKMLATALSRGLVLATVIASVAISVSMTLTARYAVIPAPNVANNFVYRLDRLTGKMQFCGQVRCVDLTHGETAN